MRRSHRTRRRPNVGRKPAPSRRGFSLPALAAEPHRHQQVTKGFARYDWLDMQPMTHRLTLELQKLERDSYDVCSICGRSFRMADTAHSGYDSADHPLYVGDCCAPRLAETAVRTYWTPRSYELPPDHSSLWRYLDLAKFVSMLGSRGIHFTSANQLGDSWEGAKGATSNKAAWDAHFRKSFEQAIRNPPPGFTNTMSDSEIEARAKDLLNQLASLNMLALRTTYVSCWHENESESEALWRLYCPLPTTALRYEPRSHT